MPYNTADMDLVSWLVQIGPSSCWSGRTSNRILCSLHQDIPLCARRIDQDRICHVGLLEAMEQQARS